MPKKASSNVKSAQQSPLIDLSQDQQWDIINKTGILHKVPGAKSTKTAANGNTSTEPLKDEEPRLLAAVLMSFPMIMFHLTLDYVVHFQYGFLSDFTVMHVLSRELPLVPALTVFIYVTGLYKHLKVVQWLLAAAALIVGNMLIYYTTVDETFGAMLKAPGLSVVWVYLVIQMDILPAMVSLLGSLIYYHADFLVSFIDPNMWTNSFRLKEGL
ncbi:hypothetical protein BASA50_007535 [Batrachochytrium salamandrivorans]|uniref:DUF7719 domain-containing protein n=1 Tax=Batrachochytrium salamandrivorans TaxID=1357716 RepID=A0ABQ8F725_9FUNG|nr:hypothetical protein BASA62_002058 [Batrachochytrium salamandrivorans]KAH6575657.1 hypothetical protein BASA60_004961 [Batrachochytrium salamandrivorans]KAH6593327.1 hypothetical protein BASA50_007535 [Batrachochytrium salamandrivorans]KAH6595574.1 hypothetical protein BASA61_003765 [Batrachochytrium salamandrivorans]KAH9249314.1 hypothetical protein BASA81_012988 [Batrachochytrium salamandrivorans]